MCAFWQHTWQRRRCKARSMRDAVNDETPWEAEFLQRLETDFAKVSEPPSHVRRVWGARIGNGSRPASSDPCPVKLPCNAIPLFCLNAHRGQSQGRVGDFPSRWIAGYQLSKTGTAWQSAGPIMRFFKRRKTAYQAFVEKQAGSLEKLPLLSCRWGASASRKRASLTSGFHY